MLDAGGGRPAVEMSWTRSWDGSVMGVDCRVEKGTREEACGDEWGSG